MLKVKPETEDALEAERIHYLFFFDFMFFPMRVHCGEALVQWDGHEWIGAGSVVETNFSYGLTSFASSLLQDGSGYHRGHIAASLPLDNTTREVVAKGYYRERTMELFMCSYDERGKVIEKVGYASGTIVKVSQEDNVITFRAEDDAFDSMEEKDRRRKRTVEDYRMQFKGDLSGTVSSSAVGWSLNFLGSTVVNWAGVALDVLALFRRDKRRAVGQRWRARKRTYWFTTTPRMPRKWRWKNGYRIRADTLAEAKVKLYREAVRKIWSFPRGWANMIVEANGRPLEFFDLDRVRQAVDPDRWKETDPARQWGSNIGTSDRGADEGDSD